MEMLYQLSYNGTTSFPARDLLRYGTGPHLGQKGGFVAEVSHSS
jgi:hypothetical protein